MFTDNKHNAPIWEREFFKNIKEKMGTYIVLNNCTPIEKQLSQEGFVYVVKDLFDLGCSCKSVKCDIKIDYKGVVFSIIKRESV